MIQTEYLFIFWSKLNPLKYVDMTDILGLALSYFMLCKLVIGMRTLEGFH